MTKQITYRDAGVDIEAGNALVARIKDASAATRRPEMLSGLGGFAALSRLPAGLEEPVLVTGTDGVGTKLRLAIDHDRHDTIGQDLVAMCVNDVLVTGAEPLLFLDYYASGKLDVDVAERVIRSIADGCSLAGCALAGGETAEMPGHYRDGDYDLAGFCVAVVERSKLIDGSRISAGDQLIALPSSGPHSNGYSLIRAILAQQATPPSGALLDTLLAPTRIYVRSILAVLRAGLPVHGMVHITGGGFQENLPRMLATDDLAVRIDTDRWQWPEVFAWLQQAGNVAEAEMLRTFNCGIGFVLCVPDDHCKAVREALVAAGEQPLLIGAVEPRTTEAVVFA
ncbi:MAG: phosphoribosylformylglycinamidine cyclo-ligase [Pseudomonadota bacterium]